MQCKFYILIICIYFISIYLPALVDKDFMDDWIAPLTLIEVIT